MVCAIVSEFEGNNALQFLLLVALNMTVAFVVLCYVSYMVCCCSGYYVLSTAAINNNF
jgi:hypothetical protein